MVSNSTSERSDGRKSSHRGGEREADSPAGQPAAAVSDLSNGTIGADVIAAPDKKTLGTLIVSIGLALFGIFWMVAANNIPNKLGFGSLGPGFLPFWAGAIMTLIAGGLIVETVRARRGNGAPPATGTRFMDRNRLRVYGTMAALLLYIIFLPLLHFFINTFLLSAAGLALSGEPLRPRLLVIAALISGVLFAIFIYWLQIPLPGSRIFG
jgi:putative tricarboxylic transport membrane protein